MALQSNQHRTVSWDELPNADLIIDAIYEGGDSKRGKADEVISRLLPGISNSGGFRAAGGNDVTRFVILYSTGVHPDWPDELDPYRGSYSYYGDNRTPGRELHDTPRGGNRVLRRAFELAHGDRNDRSMCPVFLVFQRVSNGHPIRFLGLAVPGAKDLSQNEDLVAVWRVENGVRFQNYRAIFTILDIAKLDGDWVRDSVRQKGPDLEANGAPGPLLKWIEKGTYTPLVAPQTKKGRTEREQSPDTEVGKKMIEAIRQFCRDDDFLFEAVAVEIWRMAVSEPITVDLTRRFQDGGRDAIGFMYLGGQEDRLELTFSIEAKHYMPGTGVKTGDVSRLISRIKNREFGVLITTSHLAIQAYKEIREDGHPIIVIAGGDIVRILLNKGINSEASCKNWLDTVSDPRLESLAIVNKGDVA
jgi:AspBHI-like restriction endonuclease/restriction endonuclease